MTIKELIEILEQLPPETIVYAERDAGIEEVKSVNYVPEDGEVVI